ncbi:molecular chaperone DnaJ [Marinimicrobium sp. ABcell2]|uniref:molecular chaperone DnaJ n=1 Tax=Marinimicrobium sp. ABcell2 TaxID=3069751 RepID=UPI0027B168AC|nr:molecular chaperone DnaJ [Marinimicrobium sp. ABcell2]MDQ2075652.1 molecular chaperone DnaJ [Marinimicrobium sp. ABcell2]
MIKVLLALIAVIGAWIWLAKLRKLPPEIQRKQLLKYGGWALLGVLIFMALTGRLHWLVAVLGAMVPVVKFLLAIGLQMFPLWRQRRQQQQQQGHSPAQQGMTTDEAMATLGLKEKFKREELTRPVVVDAHRRLMQRLHPDRGGSDYLAAKINEAKEVLLKTLG